MTTKALIESLNEDLAAELGTVIRYTYQSSKATGLTGLELREMLAEEIQDELGHASFLMDVIVDLGGKPTTTPATFEKAGSIKAMLEVDLKMEASDVDNYRKHAQMADELGLVEVSLKLEEMAADEAGHAREIRRIVKGL